MNPAKSLWENVASISSRVSDGLISRSVSGSTEPSRWRWSSARFIPAHDNGCPPPPSRAGLHALIAVVKAQEIQAIIEGRHRDPFAVLGPHENEVRAWLPNTAEASVVVGQETIPMRRAHDAGFFVADSSARVYRLSTNGYEFDDPYR